VFVTCSTRLAVCLTPSLSSEREVDRASRARPFVFRIVATDDRRPTDANAPTTHEDKVVLQKNRPRFAAPRAVSPASPLSRAPRSPLAAAGVRRSVPRLARCPTLQRAPRPSLNPIAVADRELEADARSTRILYRRGRRRDDATGRGPAPGVRLQAVATRPSDRVLNRRGGVAGDAMEMVWRELWVTL